MTRWFEDITIDEPFPLGSHTFTEEEMQELCARANLTILEHSIPRKQSHSGWVVVTRRT